MQRAKKIDRSFLLVVAALTILGFFIFISASLGLLAREGASFASTAFSQAFLGVFLGSVALIICARIPYHFWRVYALHFFVLSIFASLLVFIPGIGFAHGGAHRWISLGPLSFQPGEFLKLAFVLYAAGWASGAKTDIATFRRGVIPLCIILTVPAIILLLQPNTSTLAVMLMAAAGIFIVGGGRFRDVGIVLFIGIVLIGFLVLFRPYVRDRFMTFLNPASDPLGSSYQVQQSLIAIGSGGIFGRGLGQSVQKFDYLPEPIGDSIFAVASEEFGFVGSLSLVTLFALFAYRGLSIAARARDRFGGLLVTGIVILIVSQSFVNIAAMLGIIPLTGTPLLFVSKGGSALFFTLAACGIILNVSKFTKRHHDD